jgi:hypothetical protein
MSESEPKPTDVKTEDVKLEPLESKNEAKENVQVSLNTEDVPPKLSRLTSTTDEVKLHNPNEFLLERLYKLLTDRINNKPLTNANIIEFVGLSVQLVEKAKRGTEPLTNEEKKSIVTNLIIKLIRSTQMDDELKSYFEHIFIPLMLSGVIDSLCSLKVTDGAKSGNRFFLCC